MQKTICVRIDADDYSFMSKLAKAQKGELSKAVRELVDLGRLMLAIREYKGGGASLGKAAEFAGVSISEMMALLAEFKVKSRTEYGDYLKGLENLKQAW